MGIDLPHCKGDDTRGHERQTVEWCEEGCQGDEILGCAGCDARRDATGETDEGDEILNVAPDRRCEAGEGGVVLEGGEERRWDFGKVVV